MGLDGKFFSLPLFFFRRRKRDLNPVGLGGWGLFLPAGVRKGRWGGGSGKTGLELEV